MKENTNSSDLLSTGTSYTNHQQNFQDHQNHEGSLLQNTQEDPVALTPEEHEKNKAFEMNAFKMVVLVAHRTKEIEAGMPLSVPQEPNKKDMLLALKEIESRSINLRSLEDRVIASYQQFAFLSKTSA